MPLILIFLLYPLIRYLWLRLCRDPFLSHGDSISSICRETVTTCPPDTQRSLPTVIFLIGVTLSVLGSEFSKRWGYDEVEPDWFLSIFFNGFGSLLILVSAVWLVDGMWLAWLYCAGKKGEATNWWWKRNLLEVEYNAIVAPEQPQEEDGIVVAETNVKSILLDAERRSAKKRAAVILVLYSWWTAWASAAAYSPHILELSVPVRRLPPQCDGFRLGMASDLHAGSMSGAKDTEWMVQHLNSLKPDAIALVGDIGDQPVNDVLKQKLAPLTKLEAPNGVYYTFGNHENKQHIEDYRKMFRTDESSEFSKVITHLENEHVILNRGDSDDCQIVLLGMADWSGRRRKHEGQVAPDLSMALHSTPGPNGETIHGDTIPDSSLPMIMMQHQPANMTGASRAGVGLHLSGHTHGGQLWPQHVFLGGYDGISGLHEFNVEDTDEGPSYLFVSEGVVGFGPRLRFLSKTDIAVLTLRSPDLMKAEGLVPDTHLTIATFAMYLAILLVPVSLLACFVPTLCWAKHKIQKKRMGRQQRNVGGDEDEVVVDEASTGTSSKEDERRNLV